MTRRRFARLAVAALAATGVVVVAPSPASADSASIAVAYRCVQSIGGVDWIGSVSNQTVTLTAPQNPLPGTTLQVDVTLAPQAGAPSLMRNGPAPLEDVTASGSLSLDVVLPSVTTLTGPLTLSATSTVPAVVAPTPSDNPEVAPYADLPTSVPTNVSFVVPDEPTAAMRIAPGKFQVLTTYGSGPTAGIALTTCTPEPAPVTSLQLLIGNPPIPPGSDQCEVPVGDECSTLQEVLVEVTAGPLTQLLQPAGANPTANSVDLGAVTSSPTAQQLTGAMNRVQVTDVRGSSYGWSITASASAFTGPAGGSIPASNLRLTSLTCAPTLSGSAPSTTGAPGSFGSQLTLCSVAPGAIGGAGSGSGQYAIDGTLVLDVPPFQKADSYSATLTVTLA